MVENESLVPPSMVIPLVPVLAILVLTIINYGLLIHASTAVIAEARVKINLILTDVFLPFYKYKHTAHIRVITLVKTD